MYFLGIPVSRCCSFSFAILVFFFFPHFLLYRLLFYLSIFSLLFFVFLNLFSSSLFHSPYLFFYLVVFFLNTGISILSNLDHAIIVIIMIIRTEKKKEKNFTRLFVSTSVVLFRILYNTVAVLQFNFSCKWSSLNRLFALDKFNFISLLFFFQIIIN